MLEPGRAVLELGGEVSSIPKVEELSGCDLVDDGWYYDDNAAPEMIVLCPATCEAVQGDETAGINVTFGCETLIPE